MGNKFFSTIEKNPIIAAVKDMKDLDSAINSPCRIIFLLDGDILNLKPTVKLLRDKDKLVYIHVDLMDGFSKDDIALKYINREIKPDGIITTKVNLVKSAKELGLFVIQRLFLLDSLALRSGIDSIKTIRPNAVEVLPGIIPTIIEEIRQETRIPVISGGLIRNKKDVIESLNSDAIGISTSNKDVWEM